MSHSRATPRLKDILDRLGLRQAELARLIDVSARTVSLWATGESPLPGPVAAYLGLLQRLPKDVLADELARIDGRDKMLDEGLYSLDYRGLRRRKQDGDSALAALRNGKILGSDRFGGVFAGSYEFDQVSQRNNVHVRMQVPPDGELVNGFAAGPSGALLEIVASFERAAPAAKARIEVEGRPIEIQLTYLGPLPN